MPCMVSDRTVTLKRWIRKDLEGSLLIYCRFQTFVGWQCGRPRETVEGRAFIKRSEPETSRMRWRFADPQLLCLVNGNGARISIFFVKISPPSQSFLALTNVQASHLPERSAATFCQWILNLVLSCISFVCVTDPWDCNRCPSHVLHVCHLHKFINSSTKTVLKGLFPVVYLRILCDPKSCECIRGN